MSEERIMTLHPAGKSGVRISKDKYDLVRQAIEMVLQQQGEVSFGLLTESVGALLNGRFQGSIPWYVTTVKLDMEARGILERVPGSKPQRLRLT